jgi:hypothetical protein
MRIFNRIVTFILDLYFRPLAGVSPWVGLIVLSVLGGVILLLIFKKTSNQQAIGVVKDRIRAGFLEIRLFQDDFAVMMKALGRIFTANLIYLRYSLVPLIFMMIPVVLLLAQANEIYGARPAKPGENVLVALKFHNAKDAESKQVRLVLPGGVETAAPEVAIPTEKEIDWEIRPARPGKYVLKFYVGNETLTHDLICGDGTSRVSSRRTGAGLWDQLMNPGLPPIENKSSVVSITVYYPNRVFRVFGIGLHWLVVFFLASLISGYSVKGLFGVEV